MTTTPQFRTYAEMIAEANKARTERDRYAEALSHAREYLQIIDTGKGRSAIAGIIREALDA